MRSAVAACILRWPVPVLHRALRDGFRVSGSSGPAPGRCRGSLDHDHGRVLSGLVEGGRQGSAFGRQVAEKRGSG